MKIILVGAGDMAISYAQVLNGLNFDFITVGRGKESVQRYKEKTGLDCFSGGLDKFINKLSSVSDNYIVIIAVGTEQLADTKKSSLKLNPERILVEKPGAISIQKLESLYNEVKSFSERIFIAYNRRFYKSVEQVERLILEDGGLTSFNFEFTEWVHTIKPLIKANGIKENWLFANSTHVIDLAFFLGGKPSKLTKVPKKLIGIQIAYLLEQELLKRMLLFLTLQIGKVQVDGQSSY